MFQDKVDEIECPRGSVLDDRSDETIDLAREIAGYLNVNVELN